MKKILNFFTPKKEVSLFEEQKTKAFIVIAIISIIVISISIIQFSINKTDNFLITFISASLSLLFIIINLFILKKKGVIVAGNVISIGLVILISISINIIKDDVSILFKYFQGFYTILGVFSVGVLFASKRVIIFNAIIIIATTTRVFIFSLKQIPEQTELFRVGYISNTIALIIITSVLYYAVKFAEEAINEANNNTKIKEEQNKKYTQLNTQLIISQKELKKHQNYLEKLVAERTNELDASNEELRSSNEDLKSSLERLEETQFNLIQIEKMASLGILTAGVAHEINNPLNYIMGGYEGLMTYFEETNNKNNDVTILLNSIKVGVERATNIVKSLNQFSRDNNIFTENCDIHSIIDNCLVMLHNQLKNRIEIEKKYTNETFLILGNIGKLHQVFTNILSNACQAINDKGNINISTNILNNNAIIEIKDNGSGICEKNLSKITDPFYTTKEPGKGTGLGLYLSYTIIQEHKGLLNIKSKINTGTTVTISFPLKKEL